MVVGVGGGWWALVIVGERWWALVIVGERWWALVGVDGRWWTLLETTLEDMVAGGTLELMAVVRGVEMMDAKLDAMVGNRSPS